MINIAELLKDAPVGLQLYSPLFGPVVFKGISNYTIVVKGNCSQYFDKYGRPCGFLDADCLLFPSKEVPTWEGWTAPFKFKVGDWLVYKDGDTFCQNSKRVQIQSIEDGRYIFTQGTTGSCHYIDAKCRLWTASDAEDGDVLATTNIRSCPFIYRKTDYNKDFAYYYSGINGDGDFCEGCIERTLYHFGLLSNTVPATKEQCDKLFNKMKEAGYTWNSKKKELRKINEPKFKAGDEILKPSCNEYFKIKRIEEGNGIVWYVTTRTRLADNDKRTCEVVRINVQYQSEYTIVTDHYDISNFKAGMPVLVRDKDNHKWCYTLYSHYDNTCKDTHGFCFNAGLVDWRQCIPFNDDTKHLLGTTDRCPEKYVNW